MSLDSTLMKSTQFSVIVGFVVENLACSWLNQHHSGLCVCCLVDILELIYLHQAQSDFGWMFVLGVWVST